ncbi:MAG: pilus assembly protein TadG-related protein [Bacteroidota bacterium]
MISILAAAGLSLLVGAALLGIDLGNQFYTRRQLQTVADTAALSAVNDIPQAATIASSTAGLNGFAVPGEHANTLNVVPGKYDFLTKTFTANAPVDDQNAIQVTVTTNEPYFFMLGNRQVTATATATRNDIAGLSIGTTLLSIDTEKSALLNAVLGQMLHTTLKLDVMSYQGLAGASVSLLDLVQADASIGTVEKLLGLNLKVSDLLDLTATALSQKDVLAVNTKAIEAVKEMAASTGGDLGLKLSDLVNLDLASGNAAADAQINLLQLLTLSAQVANGKNFVNIPVLGLDLGGLAKLNIALTMIEAPSIAIGPAGQDSDGHWRTQVHTAQTRLKLDLDVLSALSLGNGSSGLVHLPLYLELAAGDAQLKSITCRYPRNDSDVVVDVQSSAVRAYVGDVNPDAMTNRTVAATVKPATIVDVLGLVTIVADAEINVPGGNAELVFNGPFDATNTQRVSGLSTAGLFSALANTLNLDVNILGLDLGLGALLKPVLTALLQPIFALLDSLLAPVLALLGIEIGIADVTVFSLTCGAPQLVR